MIPRAVYDTMVFYQWAILPAGRQHATAKAVLDGWVRLCLGEELLSEVRDLLNRPAIRARSSSLTPDRVRQFLAQIQQHAEMFDNVPHAFIWPEHPDDDHIFNLAIVAKARFLVTWETRILKLAAATTPVAVRLRQLAPQLAIVTPKILADTMMINPSAPNPSQP